LLVRIVVSVNLGPSAREELSQVNELRRRRQDAKNGALHGVRERIGFARKITEDSKRRSGKADLDLLHGGFQGGAPIKIPEHHEGGFRR
jgi:hypothetical protein